MVVCNAHTDFFSTRLYKAHGMSKKAAMQWSGGSVRVDTADKQRLVQAPQQQNNLSMAPNR